MRFFMGRFGGASIGVGLVMLLMGQASSPRAQEAHPPSPTPAPKAQSRAPSPTPAPKAQARPHGQRVKVDPAAIKVEDGDGVDIHWGDNDTEIVRILGIDTPEVRRLEHNLPYDQPFGPEARAFAQGAFAAATDVALLRSPTLDPYGRTLAYVFINGRNYSVMVIKAKYSGETVSHYGDNGLAREAAEVTAAATATGASLLPFEPPYQYRARMKAVTTALKQSGQYPSN
jgi:micrococcal nuclease